jgi:hypothetical protein
VRGVMSLRSRIATAGLPPRLRLLPILEPMSVNTFLQVAPGPQSRYFPQIH